MHTSQVLHRIASRLVALTPSGYFMYCERCGVIANHETFDSATNDADSHTEHE